MTFQQTVSRISQHPKRLLLIDGFGALLSAFLLGIMLVRFEYIFGIPKSTLYFLAVLPCIFAVYDFFCFFQVKRNPQTFLKVIACANIGYCCISFALIFHHKATITFLEWTYVILEIAIVIILANLELKMAAKVKAIPKTNQYNL